MRYPVVLLSVTFALAGCGGDDSDPNHSGSAGSATGGSAGSGSSGNGAGGSSSGSSGSGNGSSGASGMGGHGGTSGAGGGSGNSSSVRGAVSLSIAAPNGCALMEQYQDFPAVPSGHPVTATEKTTTVTNGVPTEDGQTVKIICEWLGLSAPFTVRGRITIGPIGNQRMVEVSSEMTDGQTTAGGVVVRTPDLPDQYGSSPADPCMFTPIQVDEAAHSVWGQFSCGILENADKSDVCSVGPSFYFFENCAPP